MNISIDIPTLIDVAKRKSGLTFGQLAEEMHVHQPRLNEWRNHKGSPSSDQIAYMASKAGLPIIETVKALRPEWAHVWEKAKSETSDAL